MWGEGENVQEYIDEGWRRYEEGDLDGAFEQFQRASTHNPDSAEAQQGMGRVWMAREDYHRAESYLKRAIELDPALESAQRDMQECQRALNPDAVESPTSVFGDEEEDMFGADIEEPEPEKKKPKARGGFAKALMALSWIGAAASLIATLGFGAWFVFDNYLAGGEEFVDGKPPIITQRDLDGEDQVAQGDEGAWDTGEDWGDEGEWGGEGTAGTPDDATRVAAGDDGWGEWEVEEWSGDGDMGAFDEGVFDSGSGGVPEEFQDLLLEDFFEPQSTTVSIVALIGLVILITAWIWTFIVAFMSGHIGHGICLMLFGCCCAFYPMIYVSSVYEGGSKTILQLLWLVVIILNIVLKFL